ncbi:hypothetical protein X777_04422 [Ooceraea biroi]|uniref:Uncharacterized protein n=1 Tax=Ooceraea biroi TaxID=2015173 RepID=A0A026WIN0_OOCBI|nr:hypothetical protein X777_04422 [Ooceraea biroi]
MATPPDSPGPEEAFFDFESTRARQQTTRPVPIEELLRQTKFSRQEIRVMYRGFKQVYHDLAALLISIDAYVDLWGVANSVKSSRTFNDATALVHNAFCGFLEISFHMLDTNEKYPSRELAKLQIRDRRMSLFPNFLNFAIRNTNNFIVGRVIERQAVTD